MCSHKELGKDLLHKGDGLLYVHVFANSFPFCSCLQGNHFCLLKTFAVQVSLEEVAQPTHFMAIGALHSKSAQVGQKALQMFSSLSLLT